MWAVAARGATIPVTSTADGGLGSLRAALANADGGDTIDASGVSGTILLIGGELLVTNSLTILGPGPANLAVDGNATTRVFHIGANTVVSLSSLTITNGNNNSDGLGGGIYNDHATLTVSNCTVSGNSAAFGGGILNDGTYGGNAALKVVASTISGNSAVYDGGGVFQIVGTAEIGDSILNADLPDNISINYNGHIYGSVTSLGYNLSSGDGGGLLTATGDQINTDPMLGPLQDNGGPTFTHALLCGSPAIDQGKNFSGAATDQRGVGFARTVDDPTVANATGGDGTDIGAYEVQRGVCAPLDSDGDSVPDSIDLCPDTPTGAIVNTSGCSIAQLVPCAGPLSGGKWKNHGEYVSNVAKMADQFLQSGLITGAETGAIVSRAAQSSCGK